MNFDVWILVYLLLELLSSIVNGWIYSVTFKYMIFYVILVYFFHIRWTGIFRCSRVNCYMHLLIKIVEFVSIIASFNVWSL